MEVNSIFYILETKIREANESEINSPDNRDLVIEVLTEEEVKSKEKEQLQIPSEIMSGQNIRFCKAEMHQGHLLGTFSIPQKSIHKPHIRFGYAIFKNKIVFVDNNGYVQEIIKKMKENKQWKVPGLGYFFADFLEYMIADDLIFLIKLENQLADMEDKILSEGVHDFHHRLNLCRKRIMVYSHYYLQLTDMGTVLLEDDNHFFSEDEHRTFHLFVERINRLREEAMMLREYSTQIREVFQSQIDIWQNSIMKVFTVVTTIFLPLSLIAGWYGMNFKYMPELSWKYGYPFVIVLCVAVVVFCIWLFKKKKFW